MALLALVGAGPAWGAGDPPSTQPPQISARENADREAAEFIKQFQIVRVGITDAPGNGHQAYAVTVIKRLRELGYSGDIEIYYDPVVKRKLEFLIPGFRPEGPEVQKLPALGQVTVIEWAEDWRSQKLDASKSSQGARRAALGIMGGDDMEIRPWQLNVDAVIRIQPSGWTRGTIGVDGQSVEQWKEINAARFLPTHLKLAGFENPGTFLKEEMGHSLKYKDKIPGLQALLQNLDKVEMMAAYGLSYRDGPRKLANIIGGIEVAQKMHPDRFKGPVVIPLLSSFNEEEWDRFHLALKNISLDYLSVKVQGSTNAGIAETMKTLKSGDILLMPVGAVTQNVWNTLVERSTLPPTIAGTSGEDFAKARGRPYFSTKSSRGAIPGVSLATDSVKNSVISAHQEMMSPDSPLKSLANFIADSMNPSSELSNAFAQNKSAVESLPDKVSVSLNESKKHFEAYINGQAPPVSTSGVYRVHCMRDILEGMLRD